MGPVFIIAIVIGVMIVIAVISHQAAKRRRDELFLLATELGLQFDFSPGDVHDRFSGFSPLGTGHSRSSSNLLSGRIGDIDWYIFDYKYTTGSGKNRSTHLVGVVAANVPIVFPKLMMRPEGFFDKVASMAGFDDINFESERFSSRYHVHCDDRKFCYDLIHPQMIDYLMSVPARHWQIHGTNIVLTRTGRYSAAEVAEVVKLIQGFMAQVPAYVRQDRGMNVPR